MALKAVHVADVPSLDQVPESPSMTRFSTSTGLELNKAASFRIPKFLVVGHRGHGMNVLQSSDNKMRAIKENSILSFNSAAKFPLDFIEFDVQVTKDDCPVIFHDDFIISEEDGIKFEKRITELTLSEFLSYGPQKEQNKIGKSLLRKTKDGKILTWEVEADDALCTLEEAFQQVNPKLGFNIELKFDDHIVYDQEYLIKVIQSVLRVVVSENSQRNRPIIFSTFQPDAAVLVRRLQNPYPVFFLTDGGAQIFYDVRRNSLEEAMKVCLEGELQGIVSEVKGVFRNPKALTKIKESKLSLMTYGKLNNVAEAVILQHLMGVEGVIVDLVEEITEAVCEMNVKNEEEEEEIENGGGGQEVKMKPEFSQRELSFLLKLIPELIQH